MTVLHAIPVLVYEDLAAAHDWLVRCFGFAAGRVDRTPDGQPVHAEVRAREHAIWLHRVSGDMETASRTRVGADTASVAVMVDDIEAHHAHTQAEGATIVYPPTDMPYGVREYGARDLEGRVWSFMTSLT